MQRNSVLTEGGFASATRSLAINDLLIADSRRTARSLATKVLLRAYFGIRRLDYYDDVQHHYDY
jgi:hypothetical protein